MMLICAIIVYSFAVHPHVNFVFFQKTWPNSTGGDCHCFIWQFSCAMDPQRQLDQVQHIWGKLLTNQQIAQLHSTNPGVNKPDTKEE